MKSTREICQMAPVIPVLVIDDAVHAEPLAKALIAGGLPVHEVTMRTSAALDVIRGMAAVDGAVVGAGTVITAADAKAAKEAGAVFAVSPGATDRLIDACRDVELPLLPGAVTASEVMHLLERGIDMLKFFPAEAVGGAPALKSLAGPLPQASFCPTGGITPATYRDYLALPNVICVGGSWIVPKSDLDAGNWTAITDKASAVTGAGTYA
ncbi:MAG: bifunctional 4-hydroxy-2-oxoglutarate aldolase/2-dehydro-3-deoxy-phosphogluconate aldolase [Pseudomonadota bacterium]